MAHGLTCIDWDVPWLQPYQGAGRRCVQQVRTGLSNAQALGMGVQLPVRFVSQSELPDGVAYEQFIAETGRVPTREGLHDFFNGLIWRHWPLTKQRLNQLQAAQIAVDGVQAVRGPVRDALTVFDENAALLYAPDDVWRALVQKDWRHLFGGLRPRWAEVRLHLFGHALLEKLVQPRKSITAHVYRMQGAMGSMADVDAWLAQDLSAQKLASKPFAPLPVLGVPGWWPANEMPDFYADTQVFRPASMGAS